MDGYPVIIQGGMGAGVSSWRLANAVSRLGQLGVVSGTALDQILALVVVFGGLMVIALFGLVRRLPNTWHVWGAVVAIAFQMLAVLVFPVFIHKFTRKLRYSIGKSGSPNDLYKRIFRQANNFGRLVFRSEVYFTVSLM